MEQYENLEMQVVEFETEDVLETSRPAQNVTDPSLYD